MPTLAELLNPETAATELYANNPVSSGVQESAAKNEILRTPQNLDTAVGQLASRGGGNPSSTTVDRNAGASGSGSGADAGFAGGISEAEARAIWSRNGGDATGWQKNPDGTWSPPGSRRLSNTGDPLLDRIENAYNQFNPKSEEEILKEETDAIQAELDAIGLVYDTRISDARTQGEDRMGRTTGLNAAAGTSFDPFGNANIERTNVANQEVIDRINAEKAAELSSILSGARTRAFDRRDSEVDRFIGLANDQVSAIADALGLSLDEEESLRNNAVARASLTGNIDGEDTLSLRKYLSDEVQQRYENSRGELDAAEQIRQAQANGKTIVRGDNGEILVYDPYTGKSESLGNYAKPVTGGGSGTGDGANSSFYDLLISDLVSGDLSYDQIVYTYGDATAKAVDKRIRELSAGGRDPFDAPPPSAATPVDDRSSGGSYGPERPSERAYTQPYTPLSADEIDRMLNPDKYKTESDRAYDRNLTETGTLFGR